MFGKGKSSLVNFSCDMAVTLGHIPKADKGQLLPCSHGHGQFVLSQSHPRLPLELSQRVGFL